MPLPLFRGLCRDGMGTAEWLMAPPHPIADICLGPRGVMTREHSFLSLVDKASLKDDLRCRGVQHQFAKLQEGSQPQFASSIRLSESSQQNDLWNQQPHLMDVSEQSFFSEADIYIHTKADRFALVLSTPSSRWAYQDLTKGNNTTGNRQLV